jgi:hypothetical protein
MPKFLLPSIFNNQIIRDEAGNIISNGLGGGVSFGYMEPQLRLEAFLAGYEVYSVLYDSIKKDPASGVVTATLVSVEFGNIDLLNKLLANEKAYKKLVDISNKLLAQQREGLAQDHVQTLKKIAELDESQHAQLESLKKTADRQAEKLANEGNWHHGTNFPLFLPRLDYLLVERKDPDVIALLEDIAAEPPKIEWSKEANFLKRERIEGVNIKEFLEPEKSENVIYIRDFREGGEFQEKADILAELEEWGVKFPTSLQTLKFHEKLVVRDTKVLSDHALAMDCFASDDIKAIAEFYRQHGREEGIVLKPYLIYGGSTVFLLDGGIADDKLEEEITKTLVEFRKSEAVFTKGRNMMGICDFSRLIAQKRLNNLDNDEEHNLYAGDIRFTAINGEFVGGVLRCKGYDGFKLWNNLLPDNKQFTPENIEGFIARAKDAKDANQISYYENLRQAFHIAQNVTKWCGDNGHFHVGFDVLIGRDSAGKWTNSLTELNTGWPDGIMAQTWRNQDCGVESKWLKPCAAIVEIVKLGQYISPLKLKKEAAADFAPTSVSAAVTQLSPKLLP